MSSAFLPDNSKLFEDAGLPPLQTSIDDGELILATLVESGPQSLNRRPATAIENEPARSMLERFVDSFFRRENIRWLAVIGAAIVVASSLMIVMNEWSDWPIQGKFLTILAYTGLTYLFSEFGRKNLGLQITARVLQYLTLLLLPICFLSLSWLFGPTSAYTTSTGVQMLVLLAPALGLTWYSASRIFEYLWRGKQQTFLASYLILCVCGAMPQLHDATLAMLVTCGLWLVATVGAIKINRHVFWITEVHGLPRAFGFLPIALLGLQFLSLVAIKTGMALPIEWMGFGLVLMSSTILMTTRAVADVHRQRTGGNMRPLPWNILAPLVVGVSMSLLGVVVSFYGFSYVSQTTYAAVPSALLAGLMMFQATRETNQRAFVWIGLVLMTISYQCAPTLVSGLVQQLKSNAAYAVGEERLPLAFYGLSYLPFLLTIASASSLLARRNKNTFAIPMRHFVTILSLALFALSWTHIKACFPVAVVNLWLFSFYAMMFRDRRYTMPAIAALTIAVGAWIPFVNAMQLAEVHFLHIVTSLSVYACILAAFPQFDRLINRLPLPSANWSSELNDQRGEPLPLCYLISTFLSVGMAAIWLMWVIACVGVSKALGDGASPAQVATVIGLIPLAAVVANFAILTIRTRSVYFSLAMWSMIATASIASAIYLQVPSLEIASSTTIVCAAVSVLSLLPLNGKSALSSATYFKQFSRPLKEDETVSLVTAFLFPLHVVSTAVLLSLIAAVHVPTVLVSNVTLIPLYIPLATISVLVWLVAIRLAFKNQGAGVAAAVVFPLVCSALAIQHSTLTVTYATLPLIWSVAAVATSLVAFRSTSKSHTSVQSVALTWVFISAGLSLSSFELVARLTAIVSLTTLTITGLHRYGKSNWTQLAIAANVQILMLIVGLSGMTSWADLLHAPNLCLGVLPALSTGLAASVAVWDVRRVGFDTNLRFVCQFALRVLFAAAVLESFLISSASAYETSLLLSALTFAFAVEFIEAVRKQRAEHLWSGFAIMAVGLGWLVSQGQLQIGDGASQIAVLAMSVTALLIARLARGHSSLGFTSKTLDQIGLTCPALLVGITVYRNAIGVAQILPSADSAMLLAAAAIYFHRGLITSNRWFVIAAALVFNVASVHLWWSLSMHDLQLYLVPLGVTIIAMVQLLKKEIPVSAHNSIRNLGALVILVSPVFEILGGSWLHLITLLVLSVLVILLAIGLRIRTLVYVGTAFLFADLVAMVIRSAAANPGMLWVGGLAIGVAVIALAAICENHREQLLSKIRVLSAELATWN